MNLSNDYITGVLDGAGRLYPDRTNGTWKIVVRLPYDEVLLARLKQKWGGSVRGNAWHITGRQARALLGEWQKHTERHAIATAPLYVPVEPTGDLSI